VDDLFRCRLKKLHGSLEKAIKIFKPELVEFDEPLKHPITTGLLSQGYILSSRDVKDLVEFMELFLYD